MTLNWAVFILLVLICVPGLLVAIPKTLKNLKATMVAKMPEGKKMPSPQVLFFIAFLQSLVLIVIAVFAGLMLAEKVGFSAPFFEALVTGGNWVDELVSQLWAALVTGTIGAVIFITAYYHIFRPRLDAQTVISMESLRMNLGLSARILYGGVVEEVLTRWGLMTFIVWLCSLIVGNVSDTVIWVSIVISGVLFGLAHLPSYLAAGCKSSPAFISLAISLNLWASLFFGWLFWQHGLLAAIFSHMWFHLLWYPFDMKYSKTNNKLR